MRVIVHPAADPDREPDVTKRLAAAIADELWRLFGGDDRLNWTEAERHLAGIIGEVRREAARTALAAAPADVPPACPGGPRRRAGSLSLSNSSRTQRTAFAGGT